jgi:NADPH:quinone reductase-like Zn-dependent oxidoreductase
MKAVRFHHTRRSEVLRYEDAPDPVPAAGEALVRVRACALNHLDLWERRGLPRVTIPLPHISGSDVAAKSSRLRASTCHRFARDAAARTQLRLLRSVCIRTRQRMPQYEVLGYRNHDGGYAELGDGAGTETSMRIPDHVDFTQAAAFPLTFLTAWHMLLTRAGLKNGDDVLVLAAGSGVGQAAIQIARLHGARCSLPRGRTRSSSGRARLVQMR